MIRVYKFTNFFSAEAFRKYSAEVVFRRRLLNLNDNAGVGVARQCWARSITSLLIAPCEPFIRSFVKTVFCSWVGFAWPRWRQSRKKNLSSGWKKPLFFSPLIKALSFLAYYSSSHTHTFSAGTFSESVSLKPCLSRQSFGLKCEIN